MNASDILGFIGVVLLAAAIYMLMGVAHTLAFIGLACLALSLILAKRDANNGDPE